MTELVKFCKFFFFVLALTIQIAQGQAPKNLNLLASVPFSPQTLAGCWHYESGGKSYALLGASGGLAIMDVTIPANPSMVLQVPGINNLWREVKVAGSYAYVVTEGRDTNGIMEGIQIVNLSYLPDSAPSKIYQGDGVIQGQLRSAHSITADENYIYVNGHNMTSLGRGVIICSIADPWNPVYIGAVTNNYCHDSYVRGDTIWTSDIIAGQFSVYDISVRSNPVLLATQLTPGTFNHNSWLSDDGNTLYTTDERGNAPLASFDVSDLSNISLLDTYFTTNFSSSEVHNVRVKNNFLINPSYGSQLTLVDASRPANLIETGNYTTGSNLLWDADPYLSSGIIIATDMSPGIFYIFDPVYQSACYLEGLVTDSVSHVPLPAVLVEVLGTGNSKSTKGTGEYKTGNADPGTYSIRFSKSGYSSKTIPGITLQTGIVTSLDVELSPSGIGINSPVSSNSLTAGPNPFSAYIHLKSSSSDIENIAVYNTLGELVLQENQINKPEIQLPGLELTPGFYFIKVDLANSSAYIKMLKE